MSVVMLFCFIIFYSFHYWIFRIIKKNCRKQTISSFYDGINECDYCERESVIQFDVCSIFISVLVCRCTYACVCALCCHLKLKINQAKLGCIVVVDVISLFLFVWTRRLRSEFEIEIITNPICNRHQRGRWLCFTQCWQLSLK